VNFFGIYPVEYESDEEGRRGEYYSTFYRKWVRKSLRPWGEESKRGIPSHNFSGEKLASIPIGPVPPRY